MRRLLLALVVLVGVIVAVAVVASRRSDRPGSMMPGQAQSNPDSPTGQSSETSTPSAPDETAIDGDVADRLAAARRAGVGAVARTAEVFDAGFISRRDLIAELATKRFAPTLAERTSRQVMDLLFGLRQETGHEVKVRLVVQPVTAIAAMQPDGRVLVDVWTVAVYVADGSSTAPEQWLTAHLTMAWEAGGWLVDGWETTAGPSPMPPSEGTFASADEIARVVAWPAGGGG